MSSNCTAEPWSKFVSFTLPKKYSDSNADGWWETVMEVALDAANGCACATFRVYYDEPVGAHSVNIGDSETNNGFGGDEGTTFNAAEMEILSGRLMVFTALRGKAPNSVERILDLTLPPLGGRTTDLEICDESIGFTMPRGPGGAQPLLLKLQTPFSGLLYDLTPSAPYESGIAPKKRDQGIYAAFNRIIHDKNAAPSPPSRTGTGVRRVEIRLTP